MPRLHAVKPANEDEIVLWFTIIGEVAVNREQMATWEQLNGERYTSIIHDQYFQFLLNQNASELFARAVLSNAVAFDDEDTKDKPRTLDVDSDNDDEDWYEEYLPDGEAPFNQGDRVRRVGKRATKRIGTVISCWSIMGEYPEVVVLWDGNKNRTRWRPDELELVTE
jgi:hypothetical protein